MSESNIVKFFENQSIFLTGGTGFLGKVILEKILRSCPNIKKIYLLVRPKKGKNSKQRLDRLFSSPCFDPLKAIRQDFEQQIHLIIGDTAEPNLGIVSTDLDLLTTEVTCIIHTAANVKFDQTLDEAADLVFATKELVKLAKGMEQLKSFVFFSTAFSHCIRKDCEETFYKPPMKAEKLLKLVKALSKEKLNDITPIILGKWPNTYVFAKCICEDVLKHEAVNLPLTICRPAIVTGADQEPVPGWNDNIYNVIGIVAASALGVLTSIYCKKENIAHLVPVDHVANATLVMAAKNTSRCSRPSEIPIYNVVGFSELTWESFVNSIKAKCFDTAPVKAIWYPRLNLTDNIYFHRVMTFLRQVLLPYFIDIVLGLFGKEPMAVKRMTVVNDLVEKISYFTYNKFEFDIRNVDKLWSELSDIDQKLFMFNTDGVNPKEWILRTLYHARTYLLKDPMDTLPLARKKMFVFLVLQIILKSLFVYYVIRMLFYILLLFFSFF